MMNRIKELRKKNGLSQLDLARQLSVNQTTISQWERGTTSPAASNLSKLTKILNTSSDYLMGFSDDSNMYNYQDDEIMNEISLSLPDLFLNLIKETDSHNDEEKKLIFDILVELKSLIKNNDDIAESLDLIKENIIHIIRLLNK